MNEIAILLGITGAVMLAILLLATVVKMREVKAAQNWQTTRGKIIRSEIGHQKKRDLDDQERVLNVPAVAYEYTVNGQKFNAERISLAEIIPESEIEATVERYPVGAAVTVYYNPANPREAVLERALPVDFGKGLAGLFALFGGGGLLALLVVGKVPELIAPRLPNPENALFVTLAAGLGVFLLLFGFAQQRQALAMQTWVPVTGSVVASELNSRTEWKDGLRRTLYTPNITYTYTVGGRAYTSNRYSLGAETGWSKPQFVESQLKKHPAGSQVTVYYNPNAPAEAVLDRRLSGGWLVWALALGLLTLAAFSAGLW